VRARQEPPGRDIVVVGASAGGVEALRTLVAGLPEDFPAAMFVVLHVPPTSSVLPAILTRAGKLPAEHARDEDAIEHGRIYVAPPDYHLLVEEDVMRLERGPRENGHRWVGQWSRDCGQRYRVQVEPLTFWPQNSASGFRSEPPEACVSCGTPLEEAFALEAARIVLHLRG
jgi:hypothetical protein